jgi:hypothetical protein
MIPDRYTHEKLAQAHRQQLHHEAELERMLGELPARSRYSIRHIAALLGTFLIMLGTRLRQLELAPKQMKFD